MFADEVNNQINRKDTASGFQKLLNVVITLALIGMIAYSIFKCL